MKIKMKNGLIPKPFIYNIDYTPSENYVAFQRTFPIEAWFIFFSDFNFNPKPLLHLLPTAEPTEVTKTLQQFYLEISDRISDILKKETDAFTCFCSFIDLYRQVENSHKLLSEGNISLQLEVFSDNPIKILSREQRQTLISGNYNGIFQEADKGRQMAKFKKLCVLQKKHLEALFLAIRKEHTILFHSLIQMRGLLFRKDMIGTHYRYTGNPYDIIELAVCLLQTLKIESANSENVTHNNFISDFCRLLGIDSTQHRGFKSSLQSSNTRIQSFVKQLPALLNDYLKGPNNWVSR